MKNEIPSSQHKNFLGWGTVAIISTTVAIQRPLGQLRATCWCLHLRKKEEKAVQSVDTAQSQQLAFRLHLSVDIWEQRLNTHQAADWCSFNFDELSRFSLCLAQPDANQFHCRRNFHQVPPAGLDFIKPKMNELFGWLQLIGWGMDAWSADLLH